MEIGIYEQGMQFLWAFLWGILMGVFYDMLWGLRSRVPFLTWATDLLTGGLLLAGNWLLFLYVGDCRYRIFFLPSTAVGVVLWRKSLSGYFRVGVAFFWKIVVFPFAAIYGILKKIIEKMKNFFKNLFSNQEKSSKIKGQQTIDGGENSG